MSSLYISNNTLQYASPIQLANTLWHDPEWSVEELFSGYRAILTSEEKSNSLFLSKKCCNGFSLGKVMTNNFMYIKELNLFKNFGLCELDCIVVSSPKSILDPIFDMGPLGAEKLNDTYGPFKLVLLDILKFKGAVVAGDPWKTRRVYLEDVYRKLNSPHVLLSESIRGCKRDFFDAVSAAGSKGVVFKYIDAPYTGGISRHFLEARSSVCSGFKNVTLSGGFKFSPVLSSQDTSDGKSHDFDFDTYLAIQALETPENIKKLLGL